VSEVFGSIWWLLVTLGLLVAAGASAQQPPATPAAPAPAPGTAPALEPKAVEVLKASSSRLAAAGFWSRMAERDRAACLAIGCAALMCALSFGQLSKPRSRAITNCASESVGASPSWGRCGRVRASAAASPARHAWSSALACFFSNSRSGESGSDGDDVTEKPPSGT